MDKVSFDELKLLLLLAFLEELPLHDLHLPGVLVLLMETAISAPHLTADFDDQVIEVSLLGLKLPIADLKAGYLASETLDLLVSVSEVKPQGERFSSRFAKLLLQV